MTTQTDNPLVELIAGNIDRLINLDISGYGVIAELYQAAEPAYGPPGLA